jgi:hypothetical protein
VGAIMRGRFAALFAAAALALQGPAAAAPAASSLAGVWDGTIGNSPVRVCFDQHEWGTNGGYYYRSHLRAIPLQNPDEKRRNFVEGEGQPDATTPKWTIDRLSRDSIAGHWVRGAKSLPITLKRLQLKEQADSPCASMLFHRPRLEGVRTISKPAVKDGVRYTRLILDHRGHFDEDVSVESFALNDDGPATRAINAELRKLLADGTEGWFDCIRQGWSTGSDGYMGQTLSPHMISKRWLVAVDDVGWFCGGAHPDDAQTPLLFDRRTGKKVDVPRWFNAKAIKREKFEGETDFVETFEPAFRALIITGWKPDDDCGESVRAAEFWNSELTRTGFVFTPSLAHVEEACEEPFRVPFAKLAPYLTPEGKAEIGALQAEVAAKR